MPSAHCIRAVVAASVSTIFGFGSMMFSSYPGLVSTGKVANLANGLKQLDNQIDQALAIAG